MAESRNTRKTIVVVGLGMVGIGMSSDTSLEKVIDHKCLDAAFIEKLLSLDAAGEYHIITCGEETHRRAHLVHTLTTTTRH